MLQKLLNAAGFTYFAAIVAAAFILVCAGYLLGTTRASTVLEEPYANGVLFVLDKITSPLDHIL